MFLSVMRQVKESKRFGDRREMINACVGLPGKDMAS